MSSHIREGYLRQARLCITYLGILGHCKGCWHTGMNHNILVAPGDLGSQHFQGDLVALVVLVIPWSLVDQF